MSRGGGKLSWTDLGVERQELVVSEGSLLRHDGTGEEEVGLVFMKKIQCLYAAKDL